MPNLVPKKKKYKSEKSVPKLVQILKVRAQVGKNSELKTKFWKASAQNGNHAQKISILLASCNTYLKTRICREKKKYF